MTGKRGRPRIEYEFDPSNPVYKARQAIDDARRQFEERMAVEWARESTRVQDRFYRVLLDWSDKVSVSELCRMYGTKDRATVYRLIDEAKDALGTAAPSSMNVIASREDDVYTVEALGNKVRFTLDEDDFPTFITDDPFYVPGSELTRELLEGNSELMIRIKEEAH